MDQVQQEINLVEVEVITHLVNLMGVRKAHQPTQKVVQKSK